MKKKILVLFISLFIFTSYSNADTCSKEEINKYKKIINKVDIDYEFKVGNVDKTLAYYTVNFSNLNNDIYFVIEDENIFDYTSDKDIINDYSEGKFNLVLANGVYYLDFYSINCDDMIISKSLYLPFYNINAKSDECIGNNSNDCSEFIENYDDIKIFYSEITEEDMENLSFFDNVITYLHNNIYIVYVVLFLFLVGFIVILFRIRRKKMWLQ